MIKRQPFVKNWQRSMWMRQWMAIDSLKYEGKDLDKLIPFYQEMNFNSFLEKLNVVTEPEEMEDILLTL